MRCPCVCLCRALGWGLCSPTSICVVLCCFRAFFNKLVRNASPRGHMRFRCPMLSCQDPVSCYFYFVLLPLVVSVMLYPCTFCVALLIGLFVVCVACFTVFVNCLVKQFAICLGVVVILLLNVMDVLSVGGGLEVPCWIDGICSSKECVCCACDPSVHLGVLSIGFVYVCVYRK